MKLLMNISQAIPGHVGINLCRADAGVPEELLNDPEISAVLQ